MRMQTGKTLQEVRELLVSKGVKESDISIAVLATHTGAKLRKPDYFIFELEFGKKSPELLWGVIPRD